MPSITESLTTLFTVDPEKGVRVHGHPILGRILDTKSPNPPIAPVNYSHVFQQVNRVLAP